MGNAAVVVTVATLALLVGLPLVATTNRDPQRPNRADWHEPMGWALLMVALVLVVLGVPTATGSPPTSAPRPEPPGSSPPAPPAREVDPLLGGPS